MPSLITRGAGSARALGLISAAATPLGIDSWIFYDSGLTRSNSNRTVAKATNNGIYSTAHGGIVRRGGRFYCEFLVAGSPGSLIYGLIHYGNSLATYPGGSGGGAYTDIGFDAFGSGYQNAGGFGSGVGPTLASGDIVMLAWDSYAGKVWNGKNGTWYGSIPSTGSGSQGSITIPAGTAGNLSPAVGLFNAGTTVTLQSKNSLAYSIPTGFLPWGEAYTPSWHPVDRDVSLVLSSNNQDASCSANGYRSARGRQAMDSVIKYFFEVRVTAKSSGFAIGVADSSANLATYIGSDTHGLAYFSVDGNVLCNNLVVATGTNYGTGDIIGVAVDRSSNMVWIAKNGVWISGDPSAPAGGFTNLSGNGVLYPAISAVSPGDTAHILTAQDETYYGVPSGFYLLQ